MAKGTRIWLTRPLADSEALAAQLTPHGITSIIAPVMRIQHAAVDASALGDKPDALLITSRHAAHVLALMPADWRTLPVYCVGEATATCVTAAGFTNTITGDGDVFALLPLIVQTLRIGQQVLYLAGADTRADIPTLLGAQGIHVRPLVAYDAIAETQLPEALVGELQAGTIDGVALFSARSAGITHDLLAQHGLLAHTAKLTACCLSLNVAESAAALNCKRLLTCHRPTVDAMRDLIVSLHAETMV